MEVRLPRLGEGADSGTVASIFVKEGDLVRKEQPILELESEKAVASIPSPETGTVTGIHVKEGDEIKVGQLLISLSTVDVPSPPAVERPVIDASVGDEPEGEEGDAGAAAEPQPVEAERSADREVPEAPAGVPVAASPSVRRLARELGIDMKRVRGSQRGGRIVLADLRNYIQQLQRNAIQERSAPGVRQDVPRMASPSVDFEKWGPVARKKMTTLRRTISTRMVESWTTIPHITQFDEADVTRILALSTKAAPEYEKKGGHLTLTAFALKAVVAALKKYPMFNASIDESTGELVTKQYYHIGIAVDTEEGLIVPVLRDVDRKGLLELSVELRRLAERTRQRKVSLEEMQGGTFTVSNQGGIGSGHFTPIINKPEAAILGMGRGIVKPLVREGKVEKRTMLPLALSYDHRIVDGADAARFMVELVRLFENFGEADLNV